MTEKREWIIGDVFTTMFWGEPEVCVFTKQNSDYTFFIRLESIRNYETVKKDYCGAGVENRIFDNMQKTFIHHSNWYWEYRYRET